MSHSVFADGWQIAAKSGNNKSIARFPDVCLSPPSPPAGPLPVPYPDTAFSTDLKKGSKTVKIGGKPAALAQQSYYKASALGNEAATRSFGGNIVTHQLTGKTYFQAWAMDVKLDGKNVCRHIDITTSNHGSAPPGSPPAPTNETQTMKDAQDAVDAGKCPCCGQNLHAWQQDGDGKPFTLIKENDFWQKKIDQVIDPRYRASRQRKFDSMKDAKATARKAGDCLNVHPNEESGCAMYFNIPAGARSKYVSSDPKKGERLETPTTIAKKSFGRGERDAAIALWETANPGMQISKNKVKMNHKTPSMAGGCNDAYNVVPETAMPGTACKNIEAWQSDLEMINQFV